jgi:soluble lytic murein transglycosylase-like protein
MIATIDTYLKLLKAAGFIVLMIILLTPSMTNAKIKKKVHRDGTVSYYNHSEIGKKGKFNFKSPYNSLIESLSRNAGVDPYLIKCIIKVESNFKADAVSVAGAMGLMQIMQHIARYYNVQDPLDPEENLTTGIKHFKSLLKYFNNDIPLALAAYHAGIGRVKKRMSIPPIKSTIKYVKSILYYYNRGYNREIERRVKRLYRKIQSDGTIIIHD